MFLHVEKSVESFGNQSSQSICKQRKKAEKKNPLRARDILAKAGAEAKVLEIQYQLGLFHSGLTYFPFHKSLYA